MNRIFDETRQQMEKERLRQLEREANERALREAKERLLIPELWRKLALPGEPPRRIPGVCRSPFREERHPSFSILAGGAAFTDFASGEKGDAVEFLRVATGLEGRELLDRFREMAGVQLGTAFVPAVREVRPRTPRPPEPEKLADRSVMRIPSRGELAIISKNRKLSMAGLALAAKRGFLRTGAVKRWPGDQAFHSWILCEPNARTGACRRMDGQDFPHPDGHVYKSHSMTGKSWPLGIFALPAEPPPGAAVLMVEGEPDFLAAHHFIAAWGEPNLYPVAMLGKGQALRPEAAEMLAGWRVRIFPHGDAWAKAEQWASVIPDGGAVDAFSFDGLHRVDGSPVSDLNDCTSIHPDDAAVLEEMNPLPPRDHFEPGRCAFDFQNDARAAYWGRITGTTAEGFPVLDDRSICPF